jgi:hypothetical protein
LVLSIFIVKTSLGAIIARRTLTCRFSRLTLSEKISASISIMNKLLPIQYKKKVA